MLIDRINETVRARAGGLIDTYAVHMIVRGASKKEPDPCHSIAVSRSAQPSSWSSQD